MLSKWLFPTIVKIGFEDVKKAIENKSQDKCVIINTLPLGEQDCLIKNTLLWSMEENTMNELMENYQIKRVKIIIYGKNSCDPNIENKYSQLKKLGFSDVYIYYGGLFEWMLLQDIYGKDEFPTTNKVLDILKYKPSSIL
jgi:Rhodanese-like domain